jgi:hypothetical protein
MATPHLTDMGKAHPELAWVAQRRKGEKGAGIHLPAPHL